ncbi:MAG: histidine phosphatase family protein, partial [Lachnospiraceae bacterium]|nr:histidine phosphatase family protein [Lachnospiraceae bacterium]
EKGPNGNNHGMFQKRWADHDYHEKGGESIAMVQKRNIEALKEILSQNEGKTLVIGTHGTALSTILNYYDNSFGCDDFLRIIDWMPYIIELVFEKDVLISKTEHLHIEKEFKGKDRADGKR